MVQRRCQVPFLDFPKPQQVRNQSAEEAALNPLAQATLTAQEFLRLKNAGVLFENTRAYFVVETSVQQAKVIDSCLTLLTTKQFENIQDLISSAGKSSSKFSSSQEAEESESSSQAEVGLPGLDNEEGSSEVRLPSSANALAEPAPKGQSPNNSGSSGSEKKKSPSSNSSESPPISCKTAKTQAADIGLGPILEAENELEDVANQSPKQEEELKEMGLEFRKALNISPGSKSIHG